MQIDDIRRIIAENGVRTIIIAGMDPAGVLRGKRLTVPYFFHAVEDGANFASYILGTTTMDEVLPGLFDTGIPDVHGVLDLASFRLAPWEANSAIVLMDWQTPDGVSHPLCPRSMLKRKLSEAAEMGYSVSASLELEFYLLPVPIGEVRLGKWSGIEPASRDIHCYSILEGHFWEPVIGRLRDCFPEEIEACLPEWGQGQFEVNLYRSDPLKMADTSIMLKLAAKQIAAENGATATFMAKWREDMSGSSGHIHLSLRDKATGKPVFYDDSRPLKLSTAFDGFVAGNLDVFHASTLFYAPNVNSYKRLQSLSFAGTTRNWGVDNRTTGFRAINQGASKARLEIRLGGADLNPYLGLATGIGAGLRGIKLGLTPPEPATGNTYESDAEKVPATLAEAVAAAENDTAIREILSPAVVDNALRIARFELGVFQSTVTDLERRRYMETV
jgi:glutamine synthetase